MKKLKTIIVEENKENRDQLSLLLREHCHDVEVSALVSTIEEAVQSIEDHSPELLFLDVELLGKNDPDILKLYKQLPLRYFFSKAILNTLTCQPSSMLRTYYSSRSKLMI